MKKIIAAALSFLITTILFGQNNMQNTFTSMSFVNFKTNLSYIQGQNSQTTTSNRKLTPFAINKYETTYELWYNVRIKAEKLGYTFQNPGQGGTEGKRGAKPTEETAYQPVTMISWYDAIVWCNALSEIKEKNPCYTFNGQVLKDSNDTAACDLCKCNWNTNGYRLPTEAEWEFSARKTKNGLQDSDTVSGCLSSDSEEELLYAWTPENSNSTRIVGTAGIPFDPNAISQPATGNSNGANLYDMSGNVLEFCWDWYAEYSDNAIYGPKIGYERICRGGSWSPYTMFVYSGDRYSFDPNECYNYFGFRLAYTTELQ